MDAYLSHDGVGSYGKNAAILVYEKKKKHPLKEIILSASENDIKMKIEVD